MGRTAARTLECKIIADAMPGWYRAAHGNIKAGDVRTFNEQLWEPSSWPRTPRASASPRHRVARWRTGS